MKKILVSILVIALLTACGSNSSKENGTTTENGGSGNTTESTANSNDLSSNPDYQKGLALIAKNDCLTCHKIDEKLIGPPYRDVADKYAGIANRDSIVKHLADKVISGGTGVWGQVAMTPHPNISEADAEAIVKYIFLLKK
ncbi:MAG: c-type cytochrome [Bacteroidetes bacterium]|nr:c-type cytochrome [Bacteroidota bacterium]MBS1931846.1 c-type cytochrome [Bacteroidota bacterium]